VTAPEGGEAAGRRGEGHERGNGPTANRGAKLDARKGGRGRPIGTLGSSSTGSPLHETARKQVPWDRDAVLPQKYHHVLQASASAPEKTTVLGRASLKLAPQNGSTRQSDRACILGRTGEGLNTGIPGVIPDRCNPYLLIFVCQHQDSKFLML
jgi:hypothetical protein